MKPYLFITIFLISFMIKLNISQKLLRKNVKSKTKVNNEYLGFSKISGKELKKYMFNPKVFIVDTRDMTISAEGFFPKSIICPTSMYSWLSSIVPSKADIIIISDEDNYQNSINSLIDLKLYNLIGYGLYNEINESSSFFIQKVEYNPNTKQDIEEIVKNGENIIDIREISEYIETGVIEQAKLIPLTTFQTDYTKIPDNGNVYVFCKSGMRAVVGMTYAKRAGYTNRMVIMAGGMNKAIEEGYPLVPYPG